MKRKLFISLLLLIILISVTVLASEDNDEDSWMDPDAWARDHLSLRTLQSVTGKCCTCSKGATENENKKSQHEQQKHVEDAASIIYLKKFITMLFNRKHLKYESSLQLYKRSVMFTLQPSQLEKLEQLQDPRDLDNVLTEIFENVRIPNRYCDGQQHQTANASSGFVSSVFQLIYNALKLTKISEVRFLLIVTAVILIAWVIKNRFNIGLLTLICYGIFLYGYLHTYLECNREIEVSKMLEILKRDKGKEEIAKDSHLVKFFKGLFSSGEAQNLEYENLKNSAKLSLDFCRPDHVFIIYFNDIFLKYLQVLLEQCTSTLTSLNGTLSFPYNIISGVFLMCIICYILKLTFKYILSPSAWMQFTQRKSSGPQLTASTNIQNTHNEDRISGENLKLLLNVIKVSSNQNETLQTLEVSGVQEIKEAIVSPPECESKIIENNIEGTQCKSNSRTNLLDDISDVTLEDVPDES